MPSLYDATTGSYIGPASDAHDIASDMSDDGCIWIDSDTHALIPADAVKIRRKHFPDSMRNVYVD